MKIEIENVNHPGKVYRVEAEPFNAIKATMLKVVPTGGPGLTQSEMVAAVKAAAPGALFPGGERAGWWTKSVQLDMEAKGELVRLPTKPLRWRLKA
ncbi:DUF6958 family protein [Phenylobacterium sp.]|jgi:hypothetical protein|uniref:DUF6958 family protein n=1 Tax=Phenylobacterium sp. TaxID=1871053 RepID=UPI002F94DAC2